MKYQTGTISIAFLDLLSGALAGVIILFIIVPKGTSFASDNISEQTLSVDSLFIVIDSLFLGKDTLDQVDIRLLRETMTSLRSRVDSVEQTAISYRREVVRRKSQQVLLEDSLRSMRTALRAMEVKQQAKSKSSPAKPSPPIAETRSKPTPRTTTSTTTTAATASTTTSSSTSAKAQEAKVRPRDPMPEMLDPFMVDIRWEGTSDVDLLLLNKAGVVLCNDSRCNKKFADLERSGKRDTMQYERLRVISRSADTYEVRVAIHSRFGSRSSDGPTTISGDYYIKPDPNGPARKLSFNREVAPRQRGDDGAPGVRVGTLTITDDGDVVFNAES